MVIRRITRLRNLGIRQQFWESGCPLILYTDSGYEKVSVVGQFVINDHLAFLTQMGTHNTSSLTYLYENYDVTHTGAGEPINKTLVGHMSICGQVARDLILCCYRRIVITTVIVIGHERTFMGQILVVFAHYSTLCG